MITRLPVSVQSLLIQCTALLLVALPSVLFQSMFSFQPDLWQFALAQGVMAAGLSRLWRQPVWWLPLHLGFFSIILLARQLNLPAWIYLTAFLLLVLFYWSSFRTRVPLYLSDRKAWEAVIPLLSPRAQVSFHRHRERLRRCAVLSGVALPAGQLFRHRNRPGALVHQSRTSLDQA